MLEEQGDPDGDLLVVVTGVYQVGEVLAKVFVDVGVGVWLERVEVDFVDDFFGEGAFDEVGGVSGIAEGFFEELVVWVVVILFCHRF